MPTNGGIQSGKLVPFSNGASITLYGLGITKSKVAQLAIPANLFLKEIIIGVDVAPVGGNFVFTFDRLTGFNPVTTSSNITSTGTSINAGVYSVNYSFGTPYQFLKGDRIAVNLTATSVTAGGSNTYISFVFG